MSSDLSTRHERYGDIAGRLARHFGADPFGQLIGQIAHDFNNVLSVAVTGNEVVQTLSTDERVRRFVGTSLGALQGGQRLTGRLAALSAAQYRAEEVDVGDLLSCLRETLQARIGAERALVLQLAASQHVVRTDPLMLAVALSNLADNAREATDAGGTWTLSTRTAHREGLAVAGEFLVIESGDDGSSWTSEARTHAFDLFFSTRAAGRGLGLTQVRDVARRSGGYALIDDGAQGDTRVCLALPHAR